MISKFFEVFNFDRLFLELNRRSHNSQLLKFACPSQPTPIDFYKQYK